MCCLLHDAAREDECVSLSPVSMMWSVWITLGGMVTWAELCGTRRVRHWEKKLGEGVPLAVNAWEEIMARVDVIFAQ